MSGVPASQETISISWNQKVLHRVNKRPPTTLMLSQINPVHNLPNQFLYDQFKHHPPIDDYALTLPHDHPLCDALLPHR
jgi:hypothetical protein